MYFNMHILVTASIFPRNRQDFLSRWTLDLCINLNSYDNDLKLVVLAPYYPSAKTFELIDEIKIYRFPYFFPFKLHKLCYDAGILYNLKTSILAKLQLPLFCLFNIIYSLKIIYKERIDIIHANSLVPQGFLAVLAKIMTGRPVILTVHGSDLRIVPKFFINLVLKHVDYIISPHSELTHIVKSLGWDHIIEIPNIIDDDKFNLQITSENVKRDFCLDAKYVISFVARLDKFKDPITFIKAIPHVLKEERDVKFFVVGDGMLKSEINHLVHDFNIEDYVILTGNRTDVNEILRASTVFAALSPFENIWSSTIIEAIKSGTPCIVTKSGTTDRHLLHLFHAFLIPPNDEKRLAEAILILLHDEVLRKYLSENCIQLLMQLGFSNKSISLKTLDVYKNVLRGSGPH